MTGIRTQRALLPAALAAVLLAACTRKPPAPLAAAEAAYQDARWLKDQIDVTRARGAQTTPRGVTLSDLLAQYRAARARLAAALPSERVGMTGDEDRRALDVMRRTLAKDLREEDEPAAAAAPGSPGAIACDYDAAALARGVDGMRLLGERMYACFGRAAHELPFEGTPVLSDAEFERASEEIRAITSEAAQPVFA